MEGKCNQKSDWLRRSSPQMAVILVLLRKHLSASLCARLPRPSKWPRHSTSNLRSLNTPQAPAAKWAHSHPGAPWPWVPTQSYFYEAGVHITPSARQAQATEDNYFGTGGFFPGRGLLLSCLSMAGGNGGFCILGKCSPRGLQSWEKGCVGNKPESYNTCHVPSRRCPEPLTFPLGRRATRQKGRCVSVLSTFHRIKTRYKTEQKWKQMKQNKEKAYLVRNRWFLSCKWQTAGKPWV